MPGEDDAVGPAADHGLQQCILARIVIAGLADQQLVAMALQVFGDILHRRGEHRAADAGHQGDDQFRTVRRQRAGQQVRGVAAAFDGGADFLQRGGGELVRIVQRPGNRDFRDADFGGDISQGRRFRNRDTALDGLWPGRLHKSSIAKPAF
jgi:hypothetical protein